ncbi:MAG: hypothetical protein AAF483_24045 [Planctomycetota bacterium]
MFGSRTLLVAFIVVVGFITSNLANSCLGSQRGPYAYRTIEERVHNSELVFLARITEITGEREELGQTTFCIAFDVEQEFKGSLGEKDYFYLSAKRDSIEAWIKNKARLVLNSPADMYRNSESAQVLVDLSADELQRLSLSPRGVLRSLETERSILKAIRQSAESLPGVNRVRTFQMITEDELVRKAGLIVQDGNPIAFVAVDKPLEKWAKGKFSSADASSLQLAARALSHFRSQSNAAWIKKELAKSETSAEKKSLLQKVLKEWERQWNAKSK